MDCVEVAFSLRLAKIDPRDILGINQAEIWAVETKLKVYDETRAF
jgi:hypothetical protein